MFTIQYEFEKFRKLQDSGLDTNFKCLKCRDCKSCLKGSGQEILSMKEEFEQQVVESSIRIDKDLEQSIAFLAFIADPDENLAENDYIAIKRLNNICQKYGNNPEVRQMIVKGFQKLIDRNHIIQFSSLTKAELEMVENGKSSYTIPWDVGFKEGSLSTPARPTFDASSKTKTGLSLNDLLAKGVADLVNLVQMVLGWMIGPIALAGDIRQFYNVVLLEKEHWRFQKVLYYEDLDPKNPLIKAIIRTLIYGVKCVGAQTEYLKRLLADEVKEDRIPSISMKEEVMDLLENKCYVDDFGSSTTDTKTAETIKVETEAVLGSIKMSVKGWSISFQKPSPELTEDGISVAFAGLDWLPEIDCVKLRIQKLHFGKKKRGR